MDSDVAVPSEVDVPGSDDCANADDSDIDCEGMWWRLGRFVAEGGFVVCRVREDVANCGVSNLAVGWDTDFVRGLIPGESNELSSPVTGSDA